MAEYVHPAEVFAMLKRRGPAMATYHLRNWLLDEHPGVTAAQVRHALTVLERQGWVERTRATRPNQIEWRIRADHLHTEYSADIGIANNGEVRS